MVNPKSIPLGMITHQKILLFLFSKLTTEVSKNYIMAINYKVLLIETNIPAGKRDSNISLLPDYTQIQRKMYKSESVTTK